MRLATRLDALERRRPESASTRVAIQELCAILDRLPDAEAEEYLEVGLRTAGLDVTEVATADLARLVYFGERFAAIRRALGTA